jgi:hypothetical protein
MTAASLPIASIIVGERHRRAVTNHRAQSHCWELDAMGGATDPDGLERAP